MAIECVKEVSDWKNSCIMRKLRKFGFPPWRRTPVNSHRFCIFQVFTELFKLKHISVANGMAISGLMAETICQKPHSLRKMNKSNAIVSGHCGE
jgi:hypothetical protein